MHRHIGRRVLALMAATGVVVAAGSTAEAGNRVHRVSPTRGRVINHVDQDSDTFVGVFQRASTNTGYNFQGNLTGQGNVLSQDADADANGGDADAGTGGSGPSSTADAAAAAAETVNDAIATGGDGGEAAGVNEAEQANEAESSNALSTGDAESTNEADVAVDQTQELTITNSIVQNIEAALASATAGGATATLPVFPDNVQATIVNNVEQDADAEVIVAQEADSNTGGNVQGNVTLQFNAAEQDADADANGGDADAYTGHGGSSDADGTVVAAASTEVTADALAGDGGDAEAVNVAEQSNESDSSNAMATGDATSENSADVEVSQDLSAEIESELELELSN